MPKSHSKFVCQQCGYESPKWMGRCPDCGEWNSLVETVIPAVRAGAAARGAALAQGERATAIPLPQVQAAAYDRLATGSPELDRVLGGGIVPGSLMLLGGEPGIGKCLAGTERVLDPASGAYLPIIEWSNSLRPVLAMHETTCRLSQAPTSAFLDQGVHAIVEVKTRLGRVLRCTPSHPVFTSDGWRSVSDLAPGSRIAAPRSLPYFGSESMAEHEIKLIAYILSDGSANSQITITSAIAEVEEDLRRIADRFEMTLRIYDKSGTRAKQYRFTLPLGSRALARIEVASALKRIRSEKGLYWEEWARKASVSNALLNQWRRARAAPSLQALGRLATAAGVEIDDLAPHARDRAEMVTPIARFLHHVGLRYLKAKTKAVPDCIFRLPAAQLATFLRTLFTCDGSVHVNQGGLVGITYSTISQQLAREVQHLLLRFGFITRLRTKSMKVNGEPYSTYELQLLGVAQVKRFLSEVGLWGREAAQAKIASLPTPALPSTHFDTIPTGPEFWSRLYHVSDGASFKTMSRRAGVVIHPGRPDRPLCRTTMAALADAYPTSYLQTLARSDIYWDEIVSIVPAGEEHVYDLTVPGAANFVANDLVVHNSTLLLQVAGDVALAAGAPPVALRSSAAKAQPGVGAGGEVLYVSAEESAQQVRLRAERLGITTERLLLLPETEIEAVVETAARIKPALVVVDSIQTVASSQIASAPGSISQVRDSTLRLMQLAKGSHVPVFIIGHVTKEGTVAGPRALEHIVDAVLYLEGERFHTYRLLRGVKNRFGATNEVGVYEMRGEGLIDVENPSALFLSERSGESTGSAVIVSMEGTRPLLVEVQALASSTSFGTPRCTTNGLDHNRLLMLLAVLTKRVGLALGNQDVYVNVAGGFTLNEPAVDLGIAAAVASSFRERRVSPETVLIGEVGLGGELRAVTRAEARIREAAKLGFKRCVLPRAGGIGSGAASGIELVRAATLAEALAIALDS